MLSRRDLLESTLALAAASVMASSKQASAEDLVSIVGYEQGDPTATADPVVYNPEIVAQLISPISAKAFTIPDPIPDFPARLLSVASEFNNMDRWKNPDVVTKMLNLFGCPYQYDNGKYVAFCAAGIGYCATLVFARAAKLPTDNTTLRRLLPAVDFFNYYPSPGVLNMSRVARGKSRWIAPHGKETPPPGALVIYDWSGSANPDTVSHTGILVSVDGDQLHTFEFNTTNSEHKDGGVIRPNRRNYDKTVKGFVVTATRKIAPLPPDVK